MKPSRTPAVRLLSFAVAASAPLALLCAAALAGGAPPQGGTQAAHRTASQEFKNIQVLKNLPADQLLPLMRQVSASLGVRCDFCHDLTPGPNGRPTGFEKDTKPEKQTARKMIVMVNDLNAHQKILNKMATCYMCHHGHAMPETKVPAPAPQPGK